MAGRDSISASSGWIAHTGNAMGAWPTMRLDPLLASVRGDPRWQPFLQKMKLAD